MKKDRFHVLFSISFIIIGIMYFIVGAALKTSINDDVHYVGAFFLVGACSIILGILGYSFFRRDN